MSFFFTNPPLNTDTVTVLSLTVCNIVLALGGDWDEKWGVVNALSVVFLGVAVDGSLISTASG